MTRVIYDGFPSSKPLQTFGSNPIFQTVLRNIVLHTRTQTHAKPYMTEYNNKTGNAPDLIR